MLKEKWRKAYGGSSSALSSCFIKLKEIVKSGKIGEISYIYSNRLSFGKVRAEEDVIWSFAPHDISMILSLTDEEPCSVRKESSNILQKNISDIGIVHMEFQSGIKAHIHVSWLHPFKEQKLVVIGKMEYWFLMTQIHGRIN